MKVSVVCTVFNEEESVAALLDSLLQQSMKPDEILIVDGGSADKTGLILRKYEDLHQNIRVIIKPCSISEGRNIAVTEARNKIIAQIDGGCVAKRDWLDKITKPFENNEVGLVAGFYEMKAESIFQKAFCPYCGVHPRRFDSRCFMPSGRSVAFRKKTWEKVGGYSESLDRAGEDTLFNYRVLKEGINMVRVKDALVIWEVPRTFSEALRKFYGYAKGDAKAGIWWHPAQGLATHNIKVTSIFLRYFVFGLFLILSAFHMIFLYLFIVSLVFYFYWAIWKNSDVVQDLKVKLVLPLVQVTSDATIMVAFIGGNLTKLF